MNQIQALVLSCGWCETLFVICKSCYRGHRYCSHDCRKHGYDRARKAARHRHEQSEEAKLDHRDRSKRYRQNQLEDSVTDKGSKLLLNHLGSISSTHLDVSKLPKIGICVACGEKVWHNLEV